MKSHLCTDHPDGKQWVEGGVDSCEFHKRNRNAPRVRMGKKDRAAADKAAGTIGVDRRDSYGYIHGN